MSLLKLPSHKPGQDGVYYLVDTSQEPLGVGGMGQVFHGVRVKEKSGERMDVAVKFLFDDLPPHAIERARREASIQIHNENLVEMLEFISLKEVTPTGAVYEHFHVVSELLHGVMLFDLLNGNLTDKEGQVIGYAQELYQKYMDNRNEFALVVMKNLLSGIMALHDKGYVHRDLDPSNVMITSDRKIKILDFGIAKQIDSLCTQDRQLTNAGAFIGKPSYAAPELVAGDVNEQNKTTDIYALGILLYQLVVGKLPFTGTTQEVLKQHMFGKMPLNEVKNKYLRNIIMKATQKAQKDRYQSAAEFRVALEQYEREIVGQADPNPTPNPNPFPNPLKKIIGACAAILLVAGIAWAVIGNRNEEEERQRIAHEQMLEQRRNELASVILDSDERTYQVDSLTGCTLKTAALITEEAYRLLANGNSDKAKEGLEMLEKVISKNYRSSSDAMMLKSILLYKDASHFTPEFQQLKSNVDSTLLLPDNVEAHELMKKVVETDGANYKALYELGCDYFAGPIRTDIEGSRDIQKALDCFYEGMEHAKSNQDSIYMELFKKRIAQLE